MTFPADTPQPLSELPTPVQASNLPPPTQAQDDHAVDPRDSQGRDQWGDHLIEQQVIEQQVIEQQVIEQQVIEQQVIEQQVIEQQGDQWADHLYEQLKKVQRVRVSDGETTSILTGSEDAPHILVIVLPQLGDFDSLEYAGWLQRSRDLFTERQVAVQVVGIGDRISGQQFCRYTGLPGDRLWIDPTAALHRQLGLYAGLTLKFPGLGPEMTAWMNLMLMCAGIGSPGTLAEVLRGYRGDRQSPQLIAAHETIQLGPINLRGDLFERVGGQGFLRPFELATVRLRNLIEVLGHWAYYVPDGRYLTQRGGTFLLVRTSPAKNQKTDSQTDAATPPYTLQYMHRDRAVLGFAANMCHPLDFMQKLT